MTPCRTIADGTRAPGPRQRGVALLVILIIAGVLGVVFVTTVVGGGPDDMERERTTQAALARAKEALISYAVTYMENHPGDVPGYLPCPEKDTSMRDGAALGVCGTTYNGGTTGDNQLGRLPWFTLGIEPLRDGYGECLWYAVSATYKDGSTASNKPEMLNWDTGGRFEIVGPDGVNPLPGVTNPADLVVAVVIAPGLAFGSQTRGVGTLATPNCNGNHDPINYLDSMGSGSSQVDNANPATNAPTGNWRFVQGARSGTFNDRLIYITARDIWNAVVRRTDLRDRLRALTQKVAVCTASYPTPLAPGNGTRRLAWTVPMSTAMDYVLEGTYSDVANTVFGRASIFTSQSYILTNLYSPSPYKFMASTGDSGYCATWTANDDLWWQHWKDQIFVRVAPPFRPASMIVNDCGGGNCLHFNAAGTYAGIVLFAGRSANGQPRVTGAQRGTASSYLDAQNTDGDEDYVSPTPPLSTAYCINPNLASPSPTYGDPLRDPIAVPPLAFPPQKFWVQPC